ncbi:acyltransferase [Bradyrhizobium sp. CCGUVB1N3]|uniref:acyltransferase family protein n=1 Tax=Bradyrhizobium sp. CCGUVB1N3 TaxID=2949629 RepID=UPI0020B3A505|nr:acyltransferase [Bradyrhizobium sp. CCGUVB1N3]MCP3472110.1 acyltransferase [Bradyrhizobium sp. CCGUVB1N3]
MQGQVGTAGARIDGQATAPFGRSHTLDVLRGLAIAGVMAIHVSQSFPSGVRIVDFVFGCGWVGVNVFYFVSAMTMCLMWTQRAGESDPTRKFYIRRFLRIAPLFWLAIPLYLAVDGTGPSYNAPDGIGPVQVALTATFLHGFWPDSINSVVPGDWSIAAEMTFYLVFPFVIAAFGSRRQLYLVLAIILHLVNVCAFKPLAYAFFTAYYGPGHEAFVWNALHLSFLNQLPVFLTGCALFFGLRDGFAKSDAALFAILIASSFVADRASGSHEFNYLMINLVLGAFVFGCIRFAIRWAPLEALGRNSYSIYLSHFAVIYGLRHVWPLVDGLASLLLAYACTALIAYLLSLATWRLVERRAQDLAHRLTSSSAAPIPRSGVVAARSAA